MAETTNPTMSPAEWEIMRIVWTLDEVSSREVISIIQRKRDWSESTVKTLLGRLVKKQILETRQQGRNFTYQATISENYAMEESADQLFSHMCEMKQGAVIANLIDHTELSQSDIQKIQAVLVVKQQTAPEMVECNCIPAEQGAEA